MQQPCNAQPSACKSCWELLTAPLSSYTLTQCLSPAAAEAAAAFTGRKQSINRNSGIPYPSASAISWQTVRMGPQTSGGDMLTCVHWSIRILTVLKSSFVEFFCCSFFYFFFALLQTQRWHEAVRMRRWGIRPEQERRGRSGKRSKGSDSFAPRTPPPSHLRFLSSSRPRVLQSNPSSCRPACSKSTV